MGAQFRNEVKIHITFVYACILHRVLKPLQYVSFFFKITLITKASACLIKIHVHNYVV